MGVRFEKREGQREWGSRWIKQKDKFSWEQWKRNMQLGTSTYRNKISKNTTHNYRYLSDDMAIVRCARKKHQWAQESDCGFSEPPLMGANQKKL